MAEGYVAPGFERVYDVFEAGLAEEIGASFAAVRDGEVVADLWGGFTDNARTRAWSRDTIAPVYSTTKGVSAMIIAMLADRGLIDYEAPLAGLWPAFGANGKERVTIAQTLAHQAGVPGFPEAIDPELWLDPPACAAAIAALAPLWPPGSASGYHPLTWGYIVSEVAHRAAERSVGAILREDICQPLGLDFHIGLPESEHHRCPDMRKPARAADFGDITPPRRAAFFTKWAGPARHSTLWRKIEIPSANGHGTALAVARLYEVHATQGEIAGQRVLSQRGYAALAERRWRGDDLVVPFNLDWRTGLMGNSNGFYGPNPEALGHSGNGGSAGFGDPAARISAGYVMNKQSHHIMGDPRSLKLIEALYACL